MTKAQQKSQNRKSWHLYLTHLLMQPKADERVYFRTLDRFDYRRSNLIVVPVVRRKGPAKDDM